MLVTMYSGRVTPTPPTLSQEQRVQASRLAVANRRRRAEVKRQIKSGELSLEELFELADREECIAQMRAYDLISALPAIGDVKAERIMQKAQIAKTRRIRGLGPKQRAELFRALVRGTAAGGADWSRWCGQGDDCPATDGARSAAVAEPELDDAR
jgi:hypothetical protein